MGKSRSLRTYAEMELLPSCKTIELSRRFHAKSLYSFPQKPHLHLSFLRIPQWLPAAERSRNTRRILQALAESIQHIAVPSLLHILISLIADLPEQRARGLAEMAPRQRASTRDSNKIRTCLQRSEARHSSCDSPGEELISCDSCKREGHQQDILQELLQELLQGNFLI